MDRLDIFIKSASPFNMHGAAPYSPSNATTPAPPSIPTTSTPPPSTQPTPNMPAIPKPMSSISGSPPKGGVLGSHLLAPGGRTTQESAFYPQTLGKGVSNAGENNEGMWGGIHNWLSTNLGPDYWKYLAGAGGGALVLWLMNSMFGGRR